MTITVKKGAAEPKKLPLKKAKTGPKPMPADKFLALLEWVRRGETVSAAAKRPGLPCESTFHEWRNKSEANDQLYRNALANGVEGMVDSVFPMLDNVFHGLKIVDAPARLGRARLRIQHIQWLARCRDPAHYGAQVAGDDGTFKLINSPDDGEGKPDAKDATKKVS
ncbi:terminase small subunit-like protein [Paraburkholderia sediminicola]|uniref:terminase small subunit-like protein n=1 Tax=Paraburkholderia sediminicola TaxID=458836 RepID=UPI0038BE125A